MPPEMRENRGEIRGGAKRKLPHLIVIEDLRGELHGHTTWSDGTASVMEMAEAARRRGYSYWGVTDHSVGLGVVQGVDGERLRGQWVEIDAANEHFRSQKIDFKLLQGSEVEILSDGTLGLPDEVLKTLDVAVASIHSAQRQASATRSPPAVLRQCIIPMSTSLATPTSRLLGSRPPTELDVERVLQACVETGTVVEINANPARLDLNDVYARRAVELGCKIAINSDAHAVDGMDIMEYGIAVARRAWLTAADVINTRPLAELLPMSNT